MDFLLVCSARRRARDAQDQDPFTHDPAAPPNTRQHRIVPPPSRGCHVEMHWDASQSPRPGGVGQDGDVYAMFAGHWDNYHSLVRHGYLPQGMPTAAALARLWRARGEAMASLLQGPLACVVWDGERQQLFAMRDPMGLEPLVYTHDHASGLCRITNHADWLLAEMAPMPKVNVARLGRFLLQSGDAQTDDFFEGVERLRPRSVLNWRVGMAPRQQIYWHTPEPRQGWAPRESLAAVREALARATDAAATPEAVAELSGGVDASTVAALAAWERPGERPLQTFSMTAPGLAGLDESRRIRRFARLLPIVSHEFVIEPFGPLKDLAFYRPFGGWGPQAHPGELYVSAFHGFLVEMVPNFQVPRGPLLLSGFGGDQLFDPGPLVAAASWGLPRDLLGPLREPWRVLARRHARWPTETRPWRDPRQWVLADIAALQGSDAADDNSQGDVRLRKLLGWPWELVTRTLWREDRRAGVCRRHPMLDAGLWKCVMALGPEAVTGPNGSGKRLLREIHEGLVEGRMAWMAKSSSFDPIVERALAGDARHKIQGLLGMRVGSASTVQQLGLVDPARWQSTYEAYYRASLVPRHPALGSLALWASIAAELWLRQSQLI